MKICLNRLRRISLSGSLIILISLQALSQNKGYFQQEANHDITVSLNDERHELNGFESIEYINNSGDTLKHIYFHIWPNAYSSNETALARQLFSLRGKEILFNDPLKRGYIDSLDFKINNHPVAWELLPDNPDICIIYPAEPVHPGDTIMISTPFHVRLPEGTSSRLGHIGQSYQISQWYPKPAVYDMNGWHQMPYLDQGEFYSEFGSYDVFITLPSNYIVAASGNLRTADEIHRIDSIAADLQWMAGRYFGSLQFPPSSPEFKTLHFSGSGIHDFGWFADKRFHIRKGSVRLPESGREVTTMVMFTDVDALLWNNALYMANEAILKFSDWIGDYPYDSYTAVQTALGAGAGMEYPGLSVIGTAENEYSLEEVIIHELLHNWFYAALATNERIYPFMDESITSSYEMRYMQQKHPDARLWEVFIGNNKMAKLFGIDHLPAKSMAELEWLAQARNNLEQPVDLQAEDYTELNYGAMIYDKGAFAFNHLREYLGEEKFDSIMRTYYDEWKFRHPSPSDLRQIFKIRSGKNLDWFFDDMLSTTRRVDYSLQRIKGDSMLVRNKGEVAAPFPVMAFSGKQPLREEWYEGFSGSKWLPLPDNSFTRLELNHTHVVPEINFINNNLKKKGLFRGADPLSVRLLFPIEDPSRRTLKFMPLLSWTKPDGLMTGMGLNNGILLPKRIEYFILPFYTFRRSDLAGNALLSLNFFPYDSFIRKAAVIFNGSLFSATEFQNYHLIRTGLELDFRSDDLTRFVNHRIFAYYISASDIQAVFGDKKAGNVSFIQAGYSLDRTSAVNPFGIRAKIESNGSYYKTSAELNHLLSYNGKERGLFTRVYAGYMVREDRSNPFYSFSPTGRNGRELYLFQGEFPDRNLAFPEKFWSRQMVIDEGAISAPLIDSTGYSSWLISASLSSSLPRWTGKLPARPFINFALVDNKPVFIWEAGFKVGIWDFIEFYVPLIAPQGYATLKERIRFTLNLNFLSRLKKSITEGF